MARWQQFTNGNPGTLVDTDLGGVIPTAGDWLLLQSNLYPAQQAAFAASVPAGAGNTASCQLFRTLNGAKISLGSAVVPTNGAPVVWPAEYDLNGDIGVTISALTGPGTIVMVRQ